MRPRNAVIPLLLLPGASALFAADQLDASIAKLRMGTLVIQAPAGAKVSVEQVRHEFWFGATLPTGVFTGRTSPEDVAKFNVLGSRRHTGRLSGERFAAERATSARMQV
jgi:hypothetical protein